MSNYQPSTFFPADNPAATAHITLLQGIINRLAGNSSSCKTWCLTLVSALLGLAAAAHAPGMAFLMLVPVVIFGFLDAMYLAQEKAYRELFSRVVNDIRKGSYDRSVIFEAGASHERRHFREALQSWSVWPVYLSLLALFVVGAATGLFERLARLGTG